MWKVENSAVAMLVLGIAAVLAVAYAVGPAYCGGAILGGVVGGIAVYAVGVANRRRDNGDES